ncbi:MAG: ribosome-binding factor A [Candidatus Spechtbacterales bacterium]
MAHHAERVDETIAREAGEALARFARGDGFIATIVRVQTSPNLSVTRIFVRVFPKEYGEEARSIIYKATPAIQDYLNTRLRMRHIPKVVFVVNTERDEVAVTRELLDELEQKYGGEDI